MGYDRFWINSEHLGSSWIESRDAKNKQLGAVFDSEYKRLHVNGNFVVLRAGANFAFDEIFLSSSFSLLDDFYDDTFAQFESFLGDEENGCGFQEVSTYRSSHRVATKSVPPSKRKDGAL